MRLAITGADDFVGRAVVRRLLPAGVAPTDKRLVDRSLAGGTTCEPIIGDLNDPQILAHSVADCDAVLLLAALPGGAAEQEPAGSTLCRDVARSWPGPSPYSKAPLRAPLMMRAVYWDHNRVWHGVQCRI